jgi:adenylosuccinate lyase
MARLVRGNCLAALENQALWHERDISHSSVERVILPDTTMIVYYLLKKFGPLVEQLLVYPENMRKNLDRLHGLIYSQRVLIALAEKGLTREEAYGVVQRNAMKVWQEDRDFLTLLAADPEVTARLSVRELEELFSLEVHTRNVDYIFRRAGLLD